VSLAAARTDVSSGSTSPADVDPGVALVTGGATGIGRVAAQLFAREGANVVVGDIKHDAAKAIAAAGEAAAAGVDHVNVCFVSPLSWTPVFPGSSVCRLTLLMLVRAVHSTLSWLTSI